MSEEDLWLSYAGHAGQCSGSTVYEGCRPGECWLTNFAFDIVKRQVRPFVFEGSAKLVFHIVRFQQISGGRVGVYVPISEVEAYAKSLHEAAEWARGILANVRATQRGDQ